MHLIDITLLAAVTVFIVDLSGFTSTWKGWLGKWLGVKIGNVPPFDCSLCMTFWVGVAYMLFTRCFTIQLLAYVCGLAFCSTLISEVLLDVRELAATLVRLIWKLIDKLK